MRVDLRPLLRTDVAGCVLLGALWACGVFGCAEDPRRTAIDASQLERLYAPEVTRAVDRLGHDDGRCFRGWVERRAQLDEGRKVTPTPAAATVGEAADQARAQGWCAYEPAPDIGKQLYECLDDARSPTEGFGCHCQLVVPHLQYLAAAEGARKRFEAPNRASLDACVGDQGRAALCSLSAGTLAEAERCLARGGW